MPDVELSVAETEAYDAYLCGWAPIESFHINREGPAERIAATVTHFERALDLDAKYPLALAGLASAAS